MQVIRGANQITKPLARPVVAIGNFDGVHLGHQHIIRLAVEKARAQGGTAVAYTFRPHPQVALKPGLKLPLLTTYDEKIELLGACGLDAVVEEPFSREFSTTTPEKFFSDILVKRVGAECIVVGYDFAFGKERAGGLKALEGFCKSAGIELIVVPPQKAAGGEEVVSSSRIRQHLLAGDLEAANRLLGREFFYRGPVIRGEGRGRKIGFPTANLKLEEKLVLPYGVYATWAVVGNGANRKKYKSVTNLGVRPTFQVGDRELPALVETHLLGATLDLYGVSLEVRFVKRLREERKFPGIDALKAQISHDVGQAEIALA